LTVIPVQQRIPNKTAIIASNISLGTWFCEVEEEELLVPFLEISETLLSSDWLKIIFSESRRAIISQNVCPY
jgi:hypothetical protein